MHVITFVCCAAFQRASRTHGLGVHSSGAWGERGDRPSEVIESHRAMEKKSLREGEQVAGSFVQCGTFKTSPERDGKDARCKSSRTTWMSNREDRSATPRFIHRERETFKSDHYDFYIVAQKNVIVYSEGKKNRASHDQPCKIWPR